MIGLKPLLLTFNLLCGADALTTHIILYHGGRELIFPTQNPWVIDGIVAGQALGTSYLFARIDKKHPKMTRIMLGVVVGVRAAVVIHNAVVVHQMLR